MNPASTSIERDVKVNQRLVGIGRGRWVGYFNIWAGLLQIPGAMMPFFKTGPFAWDGLFAFWMPLVVFSLWIYVDTWAVLRAIRRDIAPLPIAA